MLNERKVLAFDFGASGGRAMCGTFQDGNISLEEIHRFQNDPVVVNETMYWDILRLFHEIKQGILKSKKFGKIDSLGIDTWGVDFGLLDQTGRLIENPIHYRDSRTRGMLKKAWEKIDKERFYEITGIQFMDINTVFQLLSLVENRGEFLKRAETLLLIPDLFNFFLTGKKAAEYSIATTTQLLDSEKRTWSDEVIKNLGIPKHLFPEIIPGGSKLGSLSEGIAEELEIQPMDVIAVSGHDTQSALTAVPAKEKDFIFISCGTWSLMGTELDRPIINSNSMNYNISNEGGYHYKASFLKNITGLWCIQESRRQWIREGKEYSFGELEVMADKSSPLRCFINPDAPEFALSGNIPRRIREFCKKTGQEIPETTAEVVRCIDESLAMKYRFAMEEIIKCTGKQYDTIYIVGGGSQSHLLCQFAANACHKTVSAGPVEATVLGNIATQLMALGSIESLEEARKIIADSPDIKMFKPQEEEQWEAAYQRFLKIL